MNVTAKISAAGELGFSNARLERIPAFLQSYLERKKLPGFSMLVARSGRVAHQSCRGVKDWDSGDPITEDTIFRVYSMTKPITSVAAMMLYEEGLFRLEHEVARYIPEFAGLRVWEAGNADQYTTRPPERPMLIRDLLTHTSGLTYDFMAQHSVDELYRRHGLAGARSTDITLADFVTKLGALPLLFSPGTRWNYSVSTDVCGRLVEIISGQTLDRFFAERILDPLGMLDTGFFVPECNVARLASCYEKDLQTREIQLQDKGEESRYLKQPSFLSGGGGLVSTIGDYYRFCQMLLNGGELEGVRLLSPKTIEFMTMNHLPGNQTLKDMGDSLFSETRFDGSGFGLGFSVVIDPVETMAPGSAGSYSWGGMASTYFWIDPVEDLIGIFMTQLMPSDSYPIRPQLQQLTYAAMTESNKRGKNLPW
jgi:CubicO group peptidase (beta-lactamase class C family)